MPANSFCPIFLGRPTFFALVAALLALVIPAQPAFAYPAKPSNSQYVIAKDGHFYVGAERVRLWGYTMTMSYRNYAEITNVAERYSKLGVNAARPFANGAQFYGNSSNLPFFAPSKKGDNSLLDRYDFTIAELKRKGIFIQATALYQMDKLSLTTWPDAEVRQITTSTTSDAVRAYIHGVAPYLSPAYEAMLVQHIKNFLNHVNPYTGRKYADEPVFAGWELMNESHFVSCVFSAPCINGTATNKIPPVLKAHLLRLWKDWQQANSTSVSASLPPTETTWNKSDLPKHREYRKFVVEQFIKVSKRLEAVARAQGPGVKVQPISYNTYAGSPLLAQHAASAAGDYVEGTLYQSPLKNDPSSRFHPFSPWLTARVRGMYNLTNVPTEGKPFVVYETSFFRPYTYRQEWGPLMLGTAATQDWDGMYLYSYGQAQEVYTGNGE
ncbi:MAG TPA: hypothetical protein VFH31_09780, partial [Pyrinomonadaceae bacterium]|nr:hypothetical protein [Pyrinomonadaceae bacterium]